MTDDPKLQMARRIAAKALRDREMSYAATSVEAAKYDENPAVRAALAAIEECTEAHARIAERDAERSNAVFEAGIGGDAGKDRNAARYRTALRIARAIRDHLKGPTA